MGIKSHHKYKQGTHEINTKKKKIEKELSAQPSG